MEDTIFLDKYINQLLQKIYTSQPLCKLIAIDDNSNPTGYPDIISTSVLFTDNTNRRISTIPFNIDIVDKQKTTLTINVSGAKLDNSNVYFKGILIRFFILCPYLLWQLDSANGESKTRPNAIVHYLLKLFNQQTTIGMSRKTNFLRLYDIQPTQQVGGFCLEMEAQDFVFNN